MSEQGPRSFATPEGDYSLLDVLQFDIPARTLFGTCTEVITVRDVTAQANDSAALELPKTSKPQYISLPIHSPGENEKGTFSFFSKSNKQKKSSSPMIRPSSSEVVNSPTLSVTPEESKDDDPSHAEGQLPTFDMINIGWSHTMPTTATASPNSKSSQVVSSIVVHEHLPQILAARRPEHTYLFTHVGKTFLWLYVNGLVRDPLSCMHFKEGFVVSHHLNAAIKDRIELVIGLSTGEVIVYHPLSAKFRVLNKQGIMHKAPVSIVKWIPGSESLILVGFIDGKLLVLDKDKDDHELEIPEDRDVTGDSEAILKCIKANKPQKYNPQSLWTLGKGSITDIAFSPDCQHVAITSLDGCLYVLDLVKERLLDVYPSYFGGVLCAAWSPDGKFIISGGQDDLVSVYLFRGKLLARGEAHCSWVKSIRFDPYLCTDRTYRFASVGEDTQIVFWEFSLNTFKKLRQSTLRRKITVNEFAPSQSTETTIHKFIPRKQCANIQPLCMQRIHSAPITHLLIKEDFIVTADHLGCVKIWSRPKEDEAQGR